MNAAQCNAIGCDLVRPCGGVFCSEHEAALTMALRNRLHQSREDWLEGKVPAAQYLAERIRMILFIAEMEGQSVPKKMHDALAQLENLL